MKKTLFVEKAELKYRAPMKESTTAGESEGKWVADVWKLDEMNLNGRVYTRELAERVVAQNLTTMAYDGHDADWATGNEYKCMVATCSNARIENNRLVVDIDFYDKDYEQRLKYLSDKGVPIGVSSVGYGEMADNGVILPETYEVVRFLDFVTMPAGEVYATMKSESETSSAELSAEAMAEKKKRISQIINSIIF